MNKENITPSQFTNDELNKIKDNLLKINDKKLCFNKYKPTKRSDGKHNFINEEGEVLSEIWFDDMSIPEFFISINRNKDGKLTISNDYLNNQVKVKLNDKWYDIDKDGNIKYTLK